MGAKVLIPFLLLAGNNRVGSMRQPASGANARQLLQLREMNP